MFIFKGLFWSLLVPLAFYVAGFDFDERGMIFLSYILLHSCVVILLVFCAACKPTNDYLIDNIKKEVLQDVIYKHECNRADGGDSDLSIAVRSKIESLNKSDS